MLEALQRSRSLPIHGSCHDHVALNGRPRPLSHLLLQLEQRTVLLDGQSRIEHIYDAQLGQFFLDYLRFATLRVRGKGLYGGILHNLIAMPYHLGGLLLRCATLMPYDRRSRDADLRLVEDQIHSLYLFELDRDLGLLLAQVKGRTVALLGIGLIVEHVASLPQGPCHLVGLEALGV